MLDMTLGIKKLIAVCGILFFAGAPAAEAGRGCCSWHGGQNYCDTSTGRWVCNDGTYSPSCTCNYVPTKPKYIDPCSKTGLYNAYKSHKANGEVMTGLSNKIWWSSCPALVRKAVYNKIK